jgi:hypothetical protein
MQLEAVWSVVVVAEKERERTRRVEQGARSKLTTLSACATCEGVVAAWVRLFQRLFATALNVSIGTMCEVDGEVVGVVCCVCVVACVVVWCLCVGMCVCVCVCMCYCGM